MVGHCHEPPRDLGQGSQGMHDWICMIRLQKLTSDWEAPLMQLCGRVCGDWVEGSTTNVQNAPPISHDGCLVGIAGIPGYLLCMYPHIILVLMFFSIPSFPTYHRKP